MQKYYPSQYHHDYTETLYNTTEYERTLLVIQYHLTMLMYQDVNHFYVISRIIICLPIPQLTFQVNSPKHLVPLSPQLQVLPIINIHKLVNLKTLSLIILHSIYIINQHHCFRYYKYLIHHLIKNHFHYSYNHITIVFMSHANNPKRTKR